MSMHEGILEEFDDEMARTRKVLAAIRVEDMDWKVSPDLRSVGWNANHIADTVSWTKGIIENSEFDIAPIDGPPHETPEVSDPKVVLANFDAAVAEAQHAISNVSVDVLSETWELKMGGQTLQSLAKGVCIRRWILNHTIHHRAILSVYLRLLGVELTPVYDE